MDKGNIFRVLGIKSLAVAAAVLFVTAVSVVKYTGGNVNYTNSDAAWHTLLTIECYNETPARVHKFLPIVSLGSEDDK